MNNVSAGGTSSVSIVVPCYNDAETLEAVLWSLVGQSYSGFEVIVVDDCSADETPTIAREFDVVYRRNERNRGLAATLNRGFKVANGRYVGVLHADCIPDSDGWLAALVAVIQRETVGAVTAVVDVDPESLSLVDRVFASRYVNGVEHAGATSPVEIGFVEDKCDLYDPAALDAVGGFDEAFSGISAGEDVDLSLRLREAGYRIVLAPDARVTHLLSTHQESLSDHLRKTLDYARVDPVIYARHGHTHRLDYVLSSGMALAALLFVLAGIPDWLAAVVPATLAVPACLYNEKVRSHLAFGLSFGLVWLAVLDRFELAGSALPLALAFVVGIPSYYVATACSTSLGSARRFGDARLLVVGPPLVLLTQLLMILGFLLGIPRAVTTSEYELAEYEDSHER